MRNKIREYERRENYLQEESGHLQQGSSAGL